MKRNNYLIRILTISLCLFCYHPLFSQLRKSEPFTAKVVLPEQGNLKNYHFVMFDDKGKISSMTTLRGNIAYVTGRSAAKYVEMIITERSGNKTSCFHKFWVHKNEAEIRFMTRSAKQRQCSLDTFPLKNVIDLQYFDKTFFEFIKSAVDKRVSLFDSLNKKYPDHSYPRNAFKHVFEADSSINSQKMKYIQNNVTEYYSFFRFKEMIDTDREILNSDREQNIFNQFPEQYKNDPEGIALQRTILGRMQQVGKKALDFQARDINGDTIDTGRMRGKYVILAFWSTGCIPCIEEIPTLRKINAKYSQNVTLISISEDKDKVKTARFIEKNKMNWINIYNNDDLLRDYAVSAIPKVILIDKKGIFVRIVEGNDLSELVKDLENEMGTN